MTSENHKTVARLLIQTVFNEGRLAMTPAFFTADARHHELDGTPADQRRGPVPFAEIVGCYRYAFPDLRVTIDGQVAEGDRVVSLLRMEGTQTGRLMGIGASGRSVAVKGVRIDRLVDGRIAESWFHWDSLGMLEQLGALPALDRRPAPALAVERKPAVPAYVPFPSAPAFPMAVEEQQLHAMVA